MVFLRVFTTACLVGLTGFCVGFIGPMVLTPGANQGPMLGKFITGPLGFVAGLIIGWWREKTRTALCHDQRGTVSHHINSLHHCVTSPLANPF